MVSAGLVLLAGKRLQLAEEFEIALTRHAGRTQVVLDYEDGNGGVLWNHNWPCHTGLGEYHVVAFHTDALKAVSLKDSFEDLVWDRAKLWHAPEGAAWKLAG